MRARVDFGFVGALAAHIAVVLATKYILERNEDAGWRFPVAAAPMVTLVLRHAHRCVHVQATRG